MINRRATSHANIKTLILDEADEMLSRGFKDQIYDVFRSCRPEVQVVLFSATMPAGRARAHAASSCATRSVSSSSATS